MRIASPAGQMPGDGVEALLSALDPAERARHAPCLRMLDWVAPLPNLEAPGYIYLAGALGGRPAGGGGCSPADAVARLAGETAELVAQAQAPELRPDLAGDPEIDDIWTAQADCARIAGMDPRDGCPVGLPATSIFPGKEFDAELRPDAPPRSLGLAAGRSQAAARLAGLLELIERDAAARWWLLGEAPRMVDPGLAATAAAELAACRQCARGAFRRTTSFLAIRSVCDVPVICALSCEPDGKGLALGLKAALDADRAARGAVAELLQMEIALHMARVRHQRGEATHGDRGALERADLALDTLPAFAASAARGGATGFSGLPDLVRCLGEKGVRVAAADLPADGTGLHVAKMVAAGLMPMPTPRIPARSGAPGGFARLMG